METKGPQSKPLTAKSALPNRQSPRLAVYRNDGEAVWEPNNARRAASEKIRGATSDLSRGGHLSLERGLMNSRPAALKCETGSPDHFGRFASTASLWLGSKWAFLVAGGVIAAWGISGPLFHYSDTWQLVINTGTTIVTFLMVFLIQNTQNRDARAINLKLDELIRAVDNARDHMMKIEKLSDVELDVLEAQLSEKRTDEKEVADEIDRIAATD